MLVDYNFERRNELTGLVVAVPAGGNGAQYTIMFPTMDEIVHHADIGVLLFKSRAIEWRSQLSMTMMRSTLNIPNAQNSEVTVIGDVAPAGWSETGGWANRIRVNGFLGGGEA